MKKRLSSKEIRNMIIELMDDVLPPWVAGYDMSEIIPCRPIVDKEIITKEYSGMYNLLIGWTVSSKLGGGQLFGTLKQWANAASKAGFNGKVLEKGTKATNEFLRPLFLFPVSDTPENRKKYPKGKQVKNGKWDPRTIYGWGSFKVFHESVINSEAVKAVKSALRSKAEDHKPIAEITEYVSRLSPVIKKGKPSYSPTFDEIKMPDMGSFHKIEKYYESLLHELGHWTGHASRLNRDGMAVLKGDHSYAYEELIAEWFACLKMNDFGLIREKRDAENQAQYIKSWKSKHPSSESVLDAFFEAQNAVRFADKAQSESESEKVETA